MPKNPLDKAKDDTKGARAEHFAAIERENTAPGSNPAAKQVHRRKRTEGSTTRLEEYTRIDKGRKA